MKRFLVALALLAPLLATSRIYSSRMWEERAPFCHKVEATAEVVAEHGLSKAIIKNINSSPAVKAMSLEDRLTLFDALVLADQRKSTFWVFDFCMERQET